MKGYCDDCEHPDSYHHEGLGCTMPITPDGLPVGRSDGPGRACGCSRTVMIVRPGKAVGGMKSERGKSAYWRMNWEAAATALADLITEHRELVERIEGLIERAEEADFIFDNNVPVAHLRKVLEGESHED